MRKPLPLSLFSLGSLLLSSLCCFAQAPCGDCVKLLERGVFNTSHFVSDKRYVSIYKHFACSSTYEELKDAMSASASVHGFLEELGISGASGTFTHDSLNKWQQQSCSDEEKAKSSSAYVEWLNSYADSGLAMAFVECTKVCARGFSAWTQVSGQTIVIYTSYTPQGLNPRPAKVTADVKVPDGFAVPGAAGRNAAILFRRNQIIPFGVNSYSVQKIREDNSSPFALNLPTTLGTVALKADFGPPPDLGKVKLSVVLLEKVWKFSNEITADYKETDPRSPHDPFPWTGHVSAPANTRIESAWAVCTDLQHDGCRFASSSNARYSADGKEAWVDTSSHGPKVAWTIRAKIDTLQDEPQNAPDKEYSLALGKVISFSVPANRKKAEISGTTDGQNWILPVGDADNHLPLQFIGKRNSGDDILYSYLVVRPAPR